METKSTCIYAKPEKSSELNPIFEATNNDVWFSELDKGFQVIYVTSGPLENQDNWNANLNPLIIFHPQFTYKSDSNQLVFLQLLSSTAEQNITYHCFNSAAHYDSAKRSYRSALKLMAFNDLELTARGTKRTRYNVAEDECRVRLLLQTLHIIFLIIG